MIMLCLVETFEALYHPSLGDGPTAGVTRMVCKPRGRKFYPVEFSHQGKRVRKRSKATHVKEARAIENSDFQSRFMNDKSEGGNKNVQKRESPAETLSRHR
jgi:hypothetical protein